MKELLIINNIPTPYRTFMFNRMAEVGQSCDFEVEVAYQAHRNLPVKSIPKFSDDAHSWQMSVCYQYLVNKMCERRL